MCRGMTDLVVSAGVVTEVAVTVDVWAVVSPVVDAADVATERVVGVDVWTTVSLVVDVDTDVATERVVDVDVWLVVDVDDRGVVVVMKVLVLDIVLGTDVAEVLIEVLDDRGLNAVVVARAEVCS